MFFDEKTASSKRVDILSEKMKQQMLQINEKNEKFKNILVSVKYESGHTAKTIITIWLECKTEHKNNVQKKNVKRKDRPNSNLYNSISLIIVEWYLPRLPFIHYAKHTSRANSLKEVFDDNRPVPCYGGA